MRTLVSTSSFAFLLCVACAPELKKTTAEEFRKTIKGEAQGTTWSITYYDIRERDLTPQVDSILKRIDASVSTYNPRSVISEWNASDSGVVVDSLFMEVLLESWRIHKLSEGTFDPTVMPLVAYWGFGPDRRIHPDPSGSRAIDSLLALVDFDTLRLRVDGHDLRFDEALQSSGSRCFLYKHDPRIQLDFNAMAQGWSVDVVAAFLRAQGLKTYFAEIGGEIVAGNPKPDGSFWHFGVDNPMAKSASRSLQAVISLRNAAMATSGNYRNFYERDGVKYSHTINPITGRPVDHSLLSTTVISPTAAEADGMATAFMVMGRDSTLRFLAKRPYLADYVHLIYDSAGHLKTYTSPQVRALVEE